ncbi:hypothetical protein ACLOJK_023121 [Asimina triloba]
MTRQERCHLDRSAVLYEQERCRSRQESCMNRSAVARNRSPVRRGQERCLWSGALFTGNRNPVLHNRNAVSKMNKRQDQGMSKEKGHKLSRGKTIKERGQGIKMRGGDAERKDIKGGSVLIQKLLALIMDRNAIDGIGAHNLEWVVFDWGVLNQLDFKHE